MVNVLNCSGAFTILLKEILQVNHEKNGETY